MILSQDMFHCICPFDYFEIDRQNTPKAAVYRWVGYWVVHCFQLRLFSRYASRLLLKKKPTQSESTKSVEGMTLSLTGPVNKSTRALHSTREPRRSFTKPHTTMVFDITLVCSGLMTKLVYRTTFFALFQLKSLERRLGKDPNLKKQFYTTIRDDFSKGYIVKIEKSTCLKTDQPREWYIPIPHHLVFHPHKPGKVRRFLNGAANFQGHALTNELLIWPDLLQNLIDMLLRLRKHPCAVSAEIEGMFQVRVFPKDQPSLPFLWRGTVQPR